VTATSGLVGLQDVPEIGALVRPLSIFLSLQRLIMVSGANRDFAMTHIDNEAAREGGAPSAYADIMFVFSMIDRLLLEWSGPTGVLRRIGPVKLHDFVLSGHELTLAGTVVDVAEARLPDGRVGVDIDVDVRLHQGERRPVSGSARVWIPGR
jgi:acyl dehydratase